MLNLHANTLRKYADNGKIRTIRTPGGQRLYDVDSFIGRPRRTEVICYCRVSTAKQKDDLARQVIFMQDKFPEARIVQDIGSSINFKRPGLRALLE